MFYFQDKEAKMAELTLFFVQEHVGICSWTKLKTCFPIGIVLYTFNLSLSKICYHPIDHVFTPSAMLFYKSAKIFNLFFSHNVANLLVMTSRLAGWRRDSTRLLARKICILKHILNLIYYLLSITMLICACAILCTYLLICCIV